MNWDVLNPTPPSPVPPGTGVGKWVLASPSAATLGRDYLRGVVRTADGAIPRIIDYLVSVPEVDPARIAMVGVSTHGFIALEAAARDPRLRVAVVLAACGDYHGFLRHSSMGMEGRPLELAPRYDAWLRAHEVIGRPARLLHAAVLMVNRDGDPIIPVECAAATARVLRLAYDRAGIPERFRYVVLPGREHGIASGEVDETLAWLERWLRGPEESDR
jgi:dienelactone hydrolase